MQRKWHYIGLGVLGALLINPFHVFGIFGIGDIVFDPTAYIQQLLQVTEAYRHTANQAIQIEHQVEQLWYEGQNLTSIEGLLRFAQSCGVGIPSFGVGFRLPFTCHEVLAMFKDIYGGAWEDPELPYDAALQQWAKTAYTAAEDASRAQGLRDALIQDTGELEMALERSRAAVGNLDAMQAQTQVVALQTQITLRQQELDMITGRMEATAQAMQASSIAHMQAQAVLVREWDGQYTRTHVGLPTFR